MKRLLLLFSFLTVYFLMGDPVRAQQQKATPTSPNIILILSDDMGYSDIGCYGSEIHTPNLDRLAQEGLRYTQFYNTSRCCPSRASLMTGLYPHQAGLGWMTSHPHPGTGYAGELNNNCVTIAEVLKKAGYSTFMTGKWHLTLKSNAIIPNLPENMKYDWPLQRGFDRFYGIILGAANYYDPADLCRDNQLISPYEDKDYRPEHYYFTSAISDNSVQFIRQRDTSKPFFMYVAYTTAHWPMQAPEEEISKYKGKYDEGYEVIRKRRFEKMKQLGVIGKNVPLSPPDSAAVTPSWKDEKNKPAMARRMETYAAMIDVMDQGIGEIVNELKKEGIDQNTVIIFLQDNGGCHEMIGAGATGTVAKNHNDSLMFLTNKSIQYSQNPPVTREGRLVRQGKDIMAGPADTYVSYMRQWANVSNTPFRMYKHWVYQGGISTPLIIHWPAGINGGGGFVNQVGHEIDIMPTIAELAHATYPSSYKGHPIIPEAGVSLVPTFFKQSLQPRVIYWEHEMNKAVRAGKWKLVCRSEMLDGKGGAWKHYHSAPWELYNLEEDPTELHDLSAKDPERVARMSGWWNTWAHKAKVLPAPWTEVK